MTTQPVLSQELVLGLMSAIIVFFGMGWFRCRRALAVVMEEVGTLRKDLDVASSLIEEKYRMFLHAMHKQLDTYIGECAALKFPSYLQLQRYEDLIQSVEGDLKSLKGYRDHFAELRGTNARQAVIRNIRELEKVGVKLNMFAVKVRDGRIRRAKRYAVYTASVKTAAAIITIMNGASSVLGDVGAEALFSLPIFSDAQQLALSTRA